MESPPAPPAKTPTRRALAKRETRARVMAAARRLFSEHGYEGATIRDIAAAAGMSTGAVFANFIDKADLFHQILIHDMAELRQAMSAAANGKDGIDDILMAVIGAGYSYYQPQLSLVRAAVSATLHSGGLRRNAPAVVVIVNLIAEQLELAAKRGELTSDPDLRARSEMIFDSFLTNFARAFYHDWTREALEARTRAQIAIVLAGIRKS